MPIDHVCNDSCFNARKTAARTVINCLRCEKPCNSKCFGFVQPQIINQLLSDSNAVFLCSNCYDIVANCKPQLKTRASTGTKRNTAPSVVNTPPKHNASDSPLVNANVSENPSTPFLSQILQLFDTINNKLTKIEDNTSIDIEINKINNNIDTNSTTNTNTNDDLFTTQSSLNNYNIENIDDKFNKLKESIIDLHAKIDTRIPSARRESDLQSEITAKMESLHKKFDNFLDGKSKPSTS